LKVDLLDDPTSDKSRQDSGRKWLGAKKLALLAISLAVLPSIFLSTIVPDAFSVATDVAVSNPEIELKYAFP